MDKPEADYQELIEKTAASIDNDVLRLLFVSVQQTNLNSSIQYAIKWYFKKSEFLLNIENFNYDNSIVFRTA
jgi:hypothetical protein